MKLKTNQNNLVDAMIFDIINTRTKRWTTLIAIRDQSIFMGIRDRKIESSLGKINGISQSLKIQEVIQDIASNERLIHAEGQNAAIDDKISYFLLNY